MNYWLIKTEPTSFSIVDLQNKPSGRDSWEGIRNYQVRNMIRDEMQVHDTGFLYHSSCKEPAIVGLVEIVKGAYPDHFALDPNSKYFDAKASASRNPWLMFDVQLKEILPEIIPLKTLKQDSQLQGLQLLQRGNRLSITRIEKHHWDYIIQEYIKHGA